MILMVSVQNLDEAFQALKGGADIVDVKNLQEALVGSAEPHLVKQVREAVPQDHHASVTLGVVPSQVGTVAMAVYSAGLLNASSVKVGFMDTSYDEAVEILKASKRALEGSETKLIGSLFADNPLYDGLDPHEMVSLSRDGKCDGFLIDTLTKDGRNLFNFLSEDELRDMVFDGKKLGMSTALSGHLNIENLDELSRINPDIVGVRGAACSKGDRNDGVHWEAVSNFKLQIQMRESGEIKVRSNGQFDYSDNGSDGGWTVIDGTGRTCAGILAALADHVSNNKESFVEVIMPDVLNVYDVIMWAEEGMHQVLTQREDEEGFTRILIKP